MKQLKTILIATIFLLSIQNTQAQSAVYGGFSVLSVRSLHPRPGAFAGFEMGNENMKLSVGFHSTLVRFDIGGFDFYATEISTGKLTQFQFKIKSSYMAVPVMYKYYFKDAKKAGHHVVLGAGVALQLVAQYEIAPGYDDEKYFTYEHITEKHVATRASIAFTSMVGYQYLFESGFGLTAHVGYDLNLESAMHLLEKGNGIYQSYYNTANVNVLTFGVGAKYAF